MNDTKTAIDYDGAWKYITEQLFSDMLKLLYPYVHSQVDWSVKPEFLTNELPKIIGIKGKKDRKRVDCLAKVRLERDHPTWQLVHIENQMRKRNTFPKRMYTYNYRIREHYLLPVVSLAILGDTNKNWRPSVYEVETLGSSLRFRFLTIKLSDYITRFNELESQTNPFAIAIMVHLKTTDKSVTIEQRAHWKWHFLRMTLKRDYPKEINTAILNFIDWLMKVPDELEQEILTKITNEFGESPMSHQPLLRISQVHLEEYCAESREEGWQGGRLEGRQEGRQEGRLEGLRESLVSQLRLKFGKVPEQALLRVHHATENEMEDIQKAILFKDKLEDVFS